MESNPVLSTQNSSLEFHIPTPPEQSNPLNEEALLPGCSYSPNEAINQAKLLHRRLTRYIKSQFFGIGIRSEKTAAKETPVHVNGRKNPLPLINRRFPNAWSRKESRLTSRLIANHLMGNRALFLVSAATRKCALLGLDVDGEKGVPWQLAAEYGSQCIKAIFPDLEPFIEMGRSAPVKASSYIWFRIYYGDTPAPVRAQIELELNRHLKTQFTSPPAGIKLDAIKGRSSFYSENKCYDREYAELIDGSKGHNEYCIDPSEGLWLPYGKALAELERRGVVPAQRAIESLNVEWVAHSNLDDYLRRRKYYGIYNGPNGPSVDPEVKFDPDLRLEKQIRFFGVLITLPCYRSMSGQRPNNIADFLAWTDRPQGNISVQQVLNVLSDHAKRRIELVSEAVEKGTFPALSSPMHYPDCTSTSQINGSSDHYLGAAEMSQRTDDQILEDPGADNWDKMCALARMSMRVCKGDINEAASKAFAVYEERGLATGDSPEERTERLARAVRITQFVNRTFNKSKCGKSQSSQNGIISAGRFPFTSEDIEARIPRLTQIITPRILEIISAHRNSLSFNMRFLATVEALFITQIVTADLQARPCNMGHISTNWLSATLKHWKKRYPSPSIAAAIDALILSNQIVRVRNHFAGIRGSYKGSCAQYRIHAQADLPSWAIGLVKAPHQVFANPLPTPGSQHQVDL